MSKLAYFVKKLQLLSTSLCSIIACYCRSACFLISCFYNSILLRVNPFFIQLFYYIFNSILGFCILTILKPRTSNFTPRSIDLFFTSVSSITVSSMSTVEMEVFSNSQLILMTFLMFIGGEIFTSMVGLYLMRPKFKPYSKNNQIESIISSTTTSPRNSSCHDQIELNIVTIPNSHEKPKLEVDEFQEDFVSSTNIKYNSFKFLGFVALVYILVIHIIGISSVLVYLTCISSAKNVVTNKGIKTFTFAIFTIVSNFSNCGFVPTNENMMVFRKNSGLLLILIPPVLLGNTLYPIFLRLFIRLLGKFSKIKEANYLLKHSREIGHVHLLPSLHSRQLVVTVFGFILLQLLLFITLEWNSDGLSGLNGYQKIVGSLFEVVNARYSGESIVDISTIAPAILVVFMVMMYLPPYTSFVPVKHIEQAAAAAAAAAGEKQVARNFTFSKLSYIVIFIVLICITERKKIKDDPLNFNPFNITFEVISAYGNVGLTTGYSCERMIKPEPSCKNKWYGFVGKWSDEGKLILIIVMLYGRLKKFNLQGGQAWKLY